MDIITVGEMVIDFIPGTEEGSYIRNPGGAPANVAIAAARNGLSAGIFCKVGDDAFGRFLIRTLEDNKVTPLSPQLCGEAVTTMAFVSLTPGGERSFTFARKPGADMFLRVSDIQEGYLGGCKVIHGGSCSLSKGEARAATIHALKRGHEMGKMVSFDVNYRNLMWDDDRQAAADAVMGILPYVDLLKISEEETDMIGGRENIDRVMKQNQVAVVIETLGAEGAECFFAGSSFVVKGRRASAIVDTTGAGDAFWGGFLSRLLIKGADRTGIFTREILEDAMRYGNVSGSLCVQSKGAIASLPARAEIELYLEED